MILKLTTEDEFKYFKWRDSYIIIQDGARTTIHQSHCEDVKLSGFRDNSYENYFSTEDLVGGIETFQAEKCGNCCS